MTKLKTQKKVKRVVIAQEKHQDGHDHLHILLEFDEVVDTTNCNFFDVVGEKHGSYEKPRNVFDVFQYVIKSDESYFSHGDIQEWKDGKALKKNEGINTMIAEKILAGSSLPDLIREHPGFCLQNQRKITDFRNFCTMMIRQSTLLTWSQVDSSQVTDERTLEIVGWINSNVKCVRQFKQAQLYLHSPPNMNKTSLVMFLASRLRVYYVAREEFYTDYDDDQYDMIVYDEFVQRDLQTLNQILDGQEVRLRTKGGQVLKRKNLPVIILSNFSPHCLYKPQECDTLLARIKCICLDSPIQIDKIKFID
jgi:hypothetical protein